MIAGVRIYVDGHPRLRAGFQEFLRSIREAFGARGLTWDLVMGHGHAVRDFMKALRTHPTALNILLIDSEGPDDGHLLETLRSDGDWQPPHGTKVDASQVFWMVQLMEAWFLADRIALKQFYGGGFHEKSLPANPMVEKVPKNDVLDGLKAATRSTQKGQYHKTVHAARILSLLSTARVQASAPNCRLFFETLLEKTAAV